jgi:hypothetical protein
MIVSEGIPGLVSVPEDANATLRFAAEQLAYYMAMLTGTNARAKEGWRVELGVDQALGKEEVEVRVGKATAAIKAGSAGGVLQGVYQFLARFGGVVWLNPWEGEEHLPRHAELVVPEGKYGFRPRFAERAFTNYPVIDEGTAGFVDWMAKRGFNGYVVNPQWPGAWEAYKRHLREPMMLRGMKASLGHHTIEFWLSAEEHFGEHPEYFALIGGERRADGQVCTSNADVRRIVAERALEFLAENPEVREVGLWPRDGFGWCECERCAAEEEPGASWWDPAVPRKTDTYLRFVNAVAENIGEARPDVTVTALAYVNYVEPPRIERPAGNVAVYFAPMLRCVKHALKDAECRRRNAEYARLVEEWREVTPGGLRMFLYLMQIDMGALPLRITEMLPANFDFMARAGVDGYVMEYVPEEWGTYGANAHLMAELSWQRTPEDRPEGGEAKLAGYYDALYGAAAGEMAQYFRRLIDDFVTPGPCAGHYDRSYTRRATRELMRLALEHLGKARALSAGSKAGWKAVEETVKAVGRLMAAGADARGRPSRSG